MTKNKTMTNTSISLGDLYTSIMRNKHDMLLSLDMQSKFRNETQNPMFPLNKAKADTLRLLNLTKIRN